MGNPGTKNIMPNRKYKDFVFSVLSRDKENLLKLYKVLHPEDTVSSNKWYKTTAFTF